MSSFHFTIVSVNGKIFDGDVESVVLTGVNGEFGILAHHTELIAALRLGLGKVTQNGTEKFFMIGNGYVDVANNRATVLVGNAAPVKDLATLKDLLSSPKPWDALEAMNEV